MAENNPSVVPAFLTKLWTLVEEESTDELICWDPSGKSFHVFDQGRFAKEILPLYFKHSNIASFIRQLNMYGFRKVAHVEQGGLKMEKDDMEFSHPYFIRDQEHLLENIKRKVSGGKVDDMKVKSDDVQRVLTDVRSMKGKQESITNKLENMKRENEALWREVALLRQKHHKQQQIVNKLIQFLVTVVGNQRGLGMKRKMPLMLNDASQLQPSSKIQKLDETNNGKSQRVTIYEVTGSSPNLPSDGDTAGNSNHQQFGDGGQSLESMLDTDTDPIDVVTVEEPLPPQHQQQQVRNSSYTTSNMYQEQQPNMSSATYSSDPAVTTSGGQQMAITSGSGTTGVAPSGGVQIAAAGQDDSADNSLSRWVLPSGGAFRAGPVSPHIEEVHGHVDEVQAELEMLKEMLSTNQYSLDANAILGLFNPEGPITQSSDDSAMFGNIDPLESLTDANNDKSESTAGVGAVVGNELVTYDPNSDTYSNLFDLPNPLLGDESVDLLSNEPVGLTTCSSTLTTPDINVNVTTPGLTINSTLANKRKKNPPIKRESVD